MDPDDKRASGRPARQQGLDQRGFAPDEPSGQGGIRRMGLGGPSGEAISDHRIEEDIRNRLAMTEGLARGVQVSVKAGEVVLEGAVGSRKIKREAGSLAQAVAGVKVVDNRLRVERDSGDSSQ